MPFPTGCETKANLKKPGLSIQNSLLPLLALLLVEATLAFLTPPLPPASSSAPDDDEPAAAAAAEVVAEAVAESELNMAGVESP